MALKVVMDTALMPMDSMVEPRADSSRDTVTTNCGMRAVRAVRALRAARVMAAPIYGEATAVHIPITGDRVVEDRIKTRIHKSGADTAMVRVTVGDK